MENKIFDYESLGRLIKSLRKKKNLTLKDLTKRLADVSDRKKRLSPSYITRIEADDDIPNPELIVTLARVLDYNVKEMLVLAREQHKQKVLRKIDAKYDGAAEKYCQSHLGTARTRAKSV